MFVKKRTLVMFVKKGTLVMFVIQSAAFSASDWLSVCPHQQLLPPVCLSHLFAHQSGGREKNTKYRQMQNTKYGNEQTARKCKVQNTGRCISCVCWPITKIGTSAKNQSWHRREWFGFAKIDSSAILEQIKQTTILHQVKFVWMKSTHICPFINIKNEYYPNLYFGCENLVRNDKCRRIEILTWVNRQWK